MIRFDFFILDSFLLSFYKSAGASFCSGRFIIYKR
ncbi:hypothetical protein RUMGNA_00636 [Mediterraneibacter gnavus ATCC 29149]|uniref:Uncharacterized protein n=1 Tax=Mediterraneibacter gnavus (strain ATCC 29149 / DSM 114966 / JCM 6515 / VPI C7-9) TaxID=411470 RepID=A7AZB9_MEDG7|nr:hypothetical protein RUMGNA_00636 [Mediterraneibacter gnavus ATCC 29149]